LIVNIIVEEKDVSDLKKWFTEYVQTFSSKDQKIQQNISLKEGHTKRVGKEIVIIGRQLGLNNQELFLAEIIALLHDVGRFDQYARYRTFNDRISEDHAAMGMKILEQHRVLNHLSAETRELILCSIKYHNKALLPVNETEPCLFFTKLLRDADKLDIWRTVIGYYYKKNGNKNDTLVLDLPDSPGISKEVYNDLINRRIVDINNVRNQNDFKLLQTGWIFDINFEPTLNYIKKHRYLEKLRGVLPASGEITEIFDSILQYRDEKIITTDTAL